MSSETIKERVLPVVNTSQETEPCKETPSTFIPRYTPERIEYLFHQAKVELDRTVTSYMEEDFDISTTEQWLYLTPAQQSAHLARCLEIIKWFLESDENKRDYENPAELSALVIHMFGGLLPAIPEQKPPPMKSAKKSGNHLLKTAIRHSALEKQFL